MRNSIGFGAYDGFGEDINLYKGSTPIRFGRGSLIVKSNGDKGSDFKQYTFEAGVTPFGIAIVILGISALVYLIYRITGRVIGS